MIRSGTGKSLCVLDANGVTWHTLSGYKLRENLFKNPSMEINTGVQNNVRTNLAKNPSFELQSGTTTVRTNQYTNPASESTNGIAAARTNLLVNPGAEATSGTITVRTNLATNPNLETGTSNYATNAGPGGVVTTSRPTDGGVYGTAYYRSTWTTANSSAGYLEYAGMSTGGITAGQVYTFSGYVRSSAATTVLLAVNFWNGSTTTGLVNGTGVALAPGKWTRVSLTATAPAGTTGAWLDWWPNNAQAVGQTLDLDAVLVEQSPILRPYFDGSTPITNLVNNPDAEVDTSWWNPTGGAAVTRDTSRSYTGAASFKVDTSTSVAFSGLAGYPGVFAGRPYTVSAYVWVPSGTSLNFACDSSGMAPQTIAGTSSWQRISMSTPAADAAFPVYLRSSAANQAAFWVDNVMVEASPTLGPFYKGNGDYTTAWTGTANASTSTMTAPGVTGASDAPSLCRVTSSTVGSGNKSIRITPTSTSTDTFADLNGMFAGSYTFKPNTTYTLSGDRTLHTDITTTEIRMFRVNVGGELAITNTSFPKTAGTIRAVTQFTTGSSTALAFVRLQGGTAAGNGEVWWDRLVLEEGVTDGSYFDGTTTPLANPAYGVGFALLNGTGTSNTVTWSGDSWQELSTPSAGGASWRVWVDSTLFRTPGGTVDASIEVANRSGSTVTYQWDVGDSGVLTGQTLAPGERKRIWTSGGNRSDNLAFIDLDLVSAQAILVRKPFHVLRRGNVAEAYFDGATEPDFTYGWTGTANASTSYQLGQAVTSANGNGQAVTFQSTHWAATGTKSLRTRPISNSADSYVAPGGDLGGMRNGFTAGKTYTISATCRLAAPQTGAAVPNSGARTIQAYYNAGAGYVNVKSAQAPNVAGSTRLSLKFVIPSGAVTEAFFRLYNGGATGDGDVWWDDIVVEEGETPGTYFDGSTSPGNNLTYAWTGTANASTSTAIAPAAINTAANRGFVFQGTDYALRANTRSLAIMANGTGNGPGAIISAGTLTSGRTYTISAYFLFPNGVTPQKVRFGFGGAIIGTTGYTTMTAGAWTRISTTQTATGTGGLTVYPEMDDSQIPVYGTICYIDDLLIEETPIVMPYFDGATTAAGDFTYAWAGTANDSVSYQRAPFVDRISGYWASNELTMFQASSAAMRGTKGMKFLAIRPSTFLYGTNGTNGTPVTPGEYVTVSYYVRPSVTRSFRAGTGYDNAAPGLYGSWVSCAAGVWTRVSLTHQVPVGATLLTMYLNSETLSTAGDSYDVDCVLIEKSAFLEDYFDGTNAADEYFTYSWTGTPHASISRATP